MTGEPQFVIEVEQEVIGALLLGGDCRKVASFLEPFHFVADAHARIYEIIRRSEEQYGTNKLPMAVKLITEDLDTVCKAQCGESARAYMTRVCKDLVVYGPSRLVKSAQSVVEQWARLKLAEEGSRLFTAMSDASVNPEKTFKEFSQAADEIASHMRAGPNRKTLVTLGEAVNQDEQPAPEQVSDEQWVTRLVYARREKIWATEKWGPRPGQTACQVPDKLIQPGDGEGWREFENA